MTDNIKNFLTYSKGERIAIIILAAVILLLTAANFFVIKHNPNVNFSLHNLDSIITLHEDAIQEIKEKEIAEQMKRTRHQDVKKKSEKNRERPRVEKPKSDIKSSYNNNKTTVKEIPIININESDTILLLELPDIGPFFARNIVDYRERLGGFIEKEQLLEVYGFDSLRFTIISPYINVDSCITNKIRVNYDDFKTILRHPYIEYEDVKKIINHRESKGLILDWESYLKVVGRDDVDGRLRWYLEF